MLRTWAFGLLTSVALLFTAPAIAPAGEVAPLSATRLMSTLGLTLGEQVAVEEGKVISRDLDRQLDTELAAMAAAWTPAPVAAVRQILMGNARTPARRASSGTAVQVPVNAADWQGVAFSGAELERLRQHLDGKPGDDINLSLDERRRLGGLSGADLAAAYRDVLKARMDAYASRGLAGIPPYARRVGDASPARELNAALAASEPLLRGQLHPVVAALRGAPLAVNSVDHRFTWSRPTIHGRSAVVLTHEVVDGSPQHLVMVQRQFFVSHTYNSMQNLTLAVPSNRGTLIVQIGRTYTDRVAGAFSGMEKNVGQKMMRETLAGAVGGLASAAITAAAGPAETDDPRVAGIGR